MKKIKWTPNGSKNYARAHVGCIVMTANVFHPDGEMKRWRAYSSIQEKCDTFRSGPIRRTMDKAKEDAVQLARELLLDHHTCLLTEMQNFDIEV